MAYWSRRIIQVLSFVLFLGLLIFVTPLADNDWGADFFPRLSPLSALATMLAAGELIVRYWPALVLLIASIILGRFFCGWVCPLGATIDITDWTMRGVRWTGGSQRAPKAEQTPALGPPLEHNRSERSSRLYDGRRLKYYLLAFLMVLVLFGSQIVGWFDPLSLAPRTYTIVIHPYITSITAALFGFLGGLPVIGGAADSIHHLLKKVLYVVDQPHFKNHIVFFLIFVLIVSFGIVYRRYWCRNLCPLGALIALVSDWALFRRTVSDACTSCRRCVRDCRMGCIEESGKGATDGECVQCMDCRRICPTDAIRFKPGQPPEQRVAVDLSRRGVLAGIAASLAVLPALKLNFFKKTCGRELESSGHIPVIRPPGALVRARTVEEGEKERKELYIVKDETFLAKCVRCGECMKACKTNGLHPTGVEAGLEGMWSPKLIPRIGHCDYSCTTCGRVCPSGAIQSLDLKSKRLIALGKARLNRNRCIPWVGYARGAELLKKWEDVNCAVCEEVCPVPTKAIRFNTVRYSDGKEIRRPFVKEELCTGCGYCEKVCPVQGRAAIIVEGRPSEVEQASDLPSVFPESIGEWHIQGEPEAYKGGSGLVKYIDGGAEPYLRYGFKQVAAVGFAKTNSEDTVWVDVWEYKNSDEAFGIFSTDSDRPESAPVIGDEARYSYLLWIWKDKYYIRIEPREGEASPSDLEAIGRAIVAKIEAKPASPPKILRYLPEENRSILWYFHQQLTFDNIQDNKTILTDERIDENVFNLSEATNAVAAEYVSPQDRETPIGSLMIVEYDGAKTCESAYERIIALRKKWKEEAIVKKDSPIFRDKEGKFSSIAEESNFLIVTFKALDEELSKHLIQQVLASLQNGG